MRAALLACVMVLPLALVGCGSGVGSPARPQEDPGHFVRTVVAELYRGETGKAWDRLHPLQQATVPRDRYVACERAAPLVGTARRIDVVRVASEKTSIPGGSGEVDSTAVTFRVLLALPGIRDPKPITHTAHVFNVDGRWAWVIGKSDYPAYAAGTCPGGG